MKTILIILASLLLAGIIISPFFWLRFLKERSVGKYLALSSVVTLILLGFSLTWMYDFILKFINNYDLLDYFDGIFLGYSFIMLLFITLSPLIFTKIIKHKFTVKNFILSLLLSVFIFVTIFLYWAFVLLPEAFSHLHDHF